MRRIAPAQPHNRDGIWYLIRRVPKPYAALDRRGIVRISTDIAVADDPRAVRAGRVVKELDNNLQAYWRGMRDGQDAEIRMRYEAAQQRAKSIGLDYLPIASFADPKLVPDDELLKRFNLLIDKLNIDSAEDVAAVFGGEEKPSLRLSDLVGEYEAIEAADLAGYSPQQLVRWRNPRTMAVRVFTEVLTEDKALVKLTRADAIKFREHMVGRITRAEIDIGTANTVMGALSRMLRAVEILHQLGIEDVFRGLRIGGEVDKQREALAADWVQNRILAEGALNGLNLDARLAIYLVADTGLRLSEACNIDPAQQIILDGKVPYYRVLPIGRKLKTVQSERDIPLVGVSLAAARLIVEHRPNGLVRYHDKGAQLSAVANKFLREHKLLQPDTTVYGLRHCFEDRLTAIEPPDKIIAELMGHKYVRPKYGAGPSLEQKRKWLQKIAFTPPTHLGPLE